MANEARITLRGEDVPHVRERLIRALVEPCEELEAVADGYREPAALPKERARMTTALALEQLENIDRIRGMIDQLGWEGAAERTLVGPGRFPLRSLAQRPGRRRRYGKRPERPVLGRRVRPKAHRLVPRADGGVHADTRPARGSGAGPGRGGGSLMAVTLKREQRDAARSLIRLKFGDEGEVGEFVQEGNFSRARQAAR